MTPIRSTATIPGQKMLDFVLGHNQGAHPIVTALITQVIAQYYTIAHKFYGIDPAVIIAQACVETGYFTSAWSPPPLNNYCGLGVTGATRTTSPQTYGWVFDPATKIWKQGLAFLNPETSVHAHCAHLLGYATPDHNSLCCFTDPRHFAVTPHLNSIKTISDFNGRWATPGTNYGTTIQGVYDAAKAA